MNIVYLPPIAFDNLKQRPQYLAEELAREHKVTYIDPTVSLMKFLLKGGQKPFKRHYEQNSNLQIRRLNGMLSLHRSMEAIWKGFCFWERLQLNRYLQTADAVWVGYAPWYDVVRDFSGIVIYDKMDEDILITQNSLMKKLIQRCEPALIRRADHIFVSAQKFLNRISEQGKTPVWVPNAVEREQGLSSQTPARSWPDGVRVFGYVGMITHWFDMDVVEAILQAGPKNHVVLVGPSEIPLIKHERLHCVGCVPKEEVGRWIESFDVCLYPFQHTELLDTIDPVKIYEYLAANKPVLAARSIETEKFALRIISYATKIELAELLKVGCFQNPFSSEEERRRFVIENDWQTRGEIVLGVLKATS